MREVKVELNNKGIVTIIALILVLTLTLGFELGMHYEKGQKTLSNNDAKFTMEQANTLMNIQAALDNKEGVGHEVYGKYDEAGKFVIGYDVDEMFDEYVTGSTLD